MKYFSSRLVCANFGFYESRGSRGYSRFKNCSRGHSLFHPLLYTFKNVYIAKAINQYFQLQIIAIAIFFKPARTICFFSWIKSILKIDRPIKFNLVLYRVSYRCRQFKVLHRMCSRLINMYKRVLDHTVSNITFIRN